jgi:hypothetical protein
MKNIKTKVHLFFCIILLAACNTTEKKTTEVQDKSATFEKPATINSPCELISLEEVKRMFAITEYPIELKDVVYTYPTCIFRWKDGKITTSATFGGQEIISKLPSEVLIVMVEKANEAMFKQATSIYKQPQEISNIGSLAVWDSRISQLTFLSNKYMFHVHVKASINDTENT